MGHFCAATDAECLEVLRKDAETQVLQFLRSGGLVQRSPAMRMAERVEIEMATLPPHVEPEIGVEALRRRKIGNREHEAVYEAIRKGDADGARAAMRRHLSNSCERLKRAHDRAAPPVAARIRKG